MKVLMNLLSLKTVPTLFWTAPSTFTIRPPFVSVVFLLLGLVIFGLGHAILFASNLGVSPWMVLSQGITVQTGWSIGWTIVVVSFLVLMFWIPLKQVPGLGTFINFFVVAAVVDVSIKFLPSFDHFLAQSLQALIGIFFIAIGESSGVIVDSSWETIETGRTNLSVFTDNNTTDLCRRIFTPAGYVFCQFQKTIVPFLTHGSQRLSHTPSLYQSFAYNERSSSEPQPKTDKRFPCKYREPKLTTKPTSSVS